jgi:hypothetical protein
MLCSEKKALLLAYAASVRKFSAAVSRLSKEVDATGESNFDLINNKTEDLLQDVAAVRVKLHTHIKIHHC